MKIKVIDIMNKIHNEEKLPEKIMYDFKTYFYDETCQDYTDYDRRYGLFSDLLDKNCGIFSCLNDEVEIIEEEKKIPEKINTIGSKWYSDYIESYIDEENKYSCYDELLMNKINEIIDYLKSKGDE